MTGKDMEKLIEEAFRVVLTAERNSYHFYLAAAVAIQGTGKQVFERLAREESGVIALLLRQCPAVLPDIVAIPREQQVHLIKDGPCGATEFRFLNHLRLALCDKQSCIELYSTFLNSFREPALCKVFQQATAMSRKLHVLIWQEYRQLDPGLTRTGADRRAKRAHIRGEGPLSPNKHTQLFFSLLDSGRDCPF